jgi:SAM-dependent methyltransferase
MVAGRAQRSPDLLDLGTGGGELLASISPHPLLTVATEAYPPNVRVAARRLVPMGIHVVQISGAPDNNVLHDIGSKGSLPFRDGAFHLVVDRNEAYLAREVARVLAPGGVFLTEQSGSAEIPELYRLLGMDPPSDPSSPWDLGLAAAQVAAAGLSPLGGGEATFAMHFQDVGALAWYLTAVPWVLPGFSIERYRPRLEQLHSKIADGGPIRIPRYAFWLEAGKA